VTTASLLEAGLLTTVQDLGRPGHLRYGIPASGPVDRQAFILANRLVGNPDTAAGLECTLAGPTLQMMEERVIAVTGADMPLTVNGREFPRWTALRVKPGDVVRLGPSRSGMRAYLALAGGVAVPLALGSRSTYLRGRLGGYRGRSLERGDLLSVGRPQVELPRLEGRAVRPELIPDYGDGVEVRVVLGPQDDRFTADGTATFLRGPYEMTHQSDRMGARLKGPVITHARGHDIISDGIPLGGVQVAGDGQPIVLLADRQSTGGYTKIATVCSFDVGRVGQVRPGQRLRFRQISVREAHAFLQAERARLDAAVGESG